MAEKGYIFCKISVFKFQLFYILYFIFHIFKNSKIRCRIVLYGTVTEMFYANNLLLLPKYKIENCMPGFGWPGVPPHLPPTVQRAQQYNLMFNVWIYQGRRWSWGKTQRSIYCRAKPEIKRYFYFLRHGRGRSVDRRPAASAGPKTLERRGR